MIEKTKLICITPVKNESWILDKFLTCTSLWADHIIIADQMSSDNTIEIASKYENVKLVKNENPYNEFERTKILLEEARNIEGRKIIFALDADEIFTSNFMNSPEWDTILKLDKGTLILMDRINITSEQDKYFGKLKMVLGFVDDGISSIENTSQAIIHNIRLPWPKNANYYYFKEIKVIHFDYVIPERTISKLIWYQCFEKIQFNHSDSYLVKKYPTFNSIDEFFRTVSMFDTKPEWFQEYKKKNIDITSLKKPMLWWNLEVLKMFSDHGIKKFKKLDISKINWQNEAKEFGFNDVNKFIVKRTLIEKITSRIIRLLKISKL
jgi:hypothetical protein